MRRWAELALGTSQGLALVISSPHQTSQASVAKIPANSRSSWSVWGWPC